MRNTTGADGIATSAIRINLLALTSNSPELVILSKCLRTHAISQEKLLPYCFAAYILEEAALG